ncbi:8490_t:CDS:2 [Entrophospora sp. SA101]|nr:8490_t:CDS:2 [Entrophospora sp. SA101]
MNNLTSNILIIVSLLIILFKAVDAQGSCCYSLSSELKQPPDLFLLNLTASHVSSKKNNNIYIAQIGLPPKYIVQDNPSSPLSFVHCQKTVKTGTLEPVYECESRDKEIFFIQILVKFPQESNNGTTNMQLPDVNVTIFGDRCEQRAVCQDLASLNENQNSDKISLGPMGTWPKYSVIIGGCILGLALVESKIKQLESYVDEGGIVNTKSVSPRLSLGSDNHEFVPASSSVVIEVDKDSSLFTSNNNSSSNRHSSHSNRSSRSHSNRLSKVDHQNLTSARSRNIKSSGSDHRDGKDSLSISNSNSSSSKNKNSAPELHHKFSTKTPSHDDKKFNNDKERSKSYQRKNKSKKSLSKQSGEKAAREEEDEDDKPLGQILSLKNLNGENNGVTNSKNRIVTDGGEEENTTKDKRLNNEKEQIIESDDEIPIGKLRR